MNLQEKLFRKQALKVTYMRKSGETVLNFWPWDYCCGWVQMVAFKEPLSTGCLLQ